MPDDIVERLRLRGTDICCEGAAEIEQLRSDLDSMEWKHNATSVNLMAAIAEIERLRAEDKFKVKAYVAEIERLQAEIKHLQENVADAVAYKEACDEVERLRADKVAISDTAAYYLHEIERLRSTLELHGTAIREYQEIIAELRASASAQHVPQHPPACA